uniref:Protein CASC1 n=1 Tax=Caenorhabditis tropicalis TaxID=1561998 RepID=A0A1I7TMQ4_9PELO
MESDMNTANQLFQCSSSLPTKPVPEFLFAHRENTEESSTRHSSNQSIRDTSGKKLSNGTQNNLSTLSILSQEPNSRKTSSQLENGNKINGVSHTPNAHPKTNGIEKQEKQQRLDSSDSELFSSEDEEPRAQSPSVQNHEDEPFFPMIDDIPTISTKHPWETEKQYRDRLVNEKKEFEDEEREREEERQAILEAEREAERKREEEAKARAILLSKHTPVMRELARRKRRLELKSKISSLPPPFYNSMKPLKRVILTGKQFDDTMRIALEITNPDPECDINEVSDYEEFYREKEACLPCKHELKENKQEKEYVQWLKSVSEENQMFFAKSLNSTCSAFQLAHLDSYSTDAEKAQKTAVHMVEFIKTFYFIKWEDLLLADNEFMLKEIYALWQDYRKKRPRVCRTHYRDYQFRFFASSIATKMKQHLLMEETPSTRQSLLSYDWLHLKPCVNTLDDGLNSVDEMLDTVVYRNPNWNIDEKKAANRYWDMFGDVPLHIETSESVIVPPSSEDQLEIIDDSNYFTKKMIKNSMYNARNYEIKLAYTKKKKPVDLFGVQDRTKKVLNREWQMRLDKMVNETRNVDLSTSSFRVNPYNKLIYTADEKHPWPVCQFDMGDHYVTVQPMISKRYEELKSRVRRKFTFRRGEKAHCVSKHVEITTDQLRKLPSFKKFEPKLQKATDFKNMISNHFKVVDRPIVESRHEIYPIIEEDEEADLVIYLLENEPLENGKPRLDPEDVFAVRRELRGYKDREAYILMMEDRYRKQLESNEKREADKMKIMKKHWMPELRKKIGVARKVIEIGRLLVEEDVRKWMEYQYELSFARKTFRNKSWITRKQMKRNVPPEWHETIDMIDFNEPVSPPRYAKPLPPLKTDEYTPGPPAYNSSSDSEDYDEDDEKPEDDTFIQYETQPDLPYVAARLQMDIREKVEMADELADDEWEYSDDSSVSSWFNNDTDDIMNRLINPDYIDEHMIMKEKLKGALGKKLWEVLEERRSPEPSDDEEENTSLEMMINKEDNEHKRVEIDLMKSNNQSNDIGNSDGKRRKELTKKEMEHDYENYNKRDERKTEMEQVRWFLKKFALDHSYTSEPYAWNDELRDAIICLHENELRRISNRLHKQVREEYELTTNQEDAIVDIIPVDENGLQYKLINFLLFRKDGECFGDSYNEANECRKILNPIQQYEMFLERKALTN